MLTPVQFFLHQAKLDFDREYSAARSLFSDFDEAMSKIMDCIRAFQPDIAAPPEDLNEGMFMFCILTSKYFEIRHFFVLVLYFCVQAVLVKGYKICLGVVL